MKNDGPTLKLTKSCFDCQYSYSERYTCQGDSGCTIYCNHPSLDDLELKMKYVGDSSWNTPEWCPIIKKYSTMYLRLKNIINIFNRIVQKKGSDGVS